MSIELKIDGKIYSFENLKELQEFIIFGDNKPSGNYSLVHQFNLKILPLSIHLIIIFS